MGDTFYFISGKDFTNEVDKVDFDFWCNLSGVKVTYTFHVEWTDTLADTGPGGETLKFLAVFDDPTEYASVVGAIKSAYEIKGYDGVSVTGGEDV